MTDTFWKTVSKLL